MDLTFTNIAERFEDLKKKFQEGGISRQEFVEEMKKLRLKDEIGRFWMIGAQSGKWYFFDGKDWIQSEPPTQKDKKAICVFCGFENKLETEICARCGGTLGEEKTACPTCGGPLRKPFMTCPRCSKKPESAEDAGIIAWAAAAEPIEVAVRSVRPRSVLFFSGLLGAFAGVVLGVLAGATDRFIGGLSFLPAALADLQGKILGTVIIGLLGGVTGFVLFAAAGFLTAILANFILSLTGGLGFTVKKKVRPLVPGDEDGPKS